MVVAFIGPPVSTSKARRGSLPTPARYTRARRSCGGGCNMKQMQCGLRRALIASAAVVTALAVRADVPAAGVAIVLPAALEWNSVPQLAPDIKVARVLGNPTAAGPYALR